MSIETTYSVVIVGPGDTERICRSGVPEQQADKFADALRRKILSKDQYVDLREETPDLTEDQARPIAAVAALVVSIAVLVSAFTLAWDVPHVRSALAMLSVTVVFIAFGLAALAVEPKWPEAQLSGILDGES